MKFQDYIVFQEVNDAIAEYDLVTSCFNEALCFDGPINEALTTPAIGKKTRYTDPKTGKAWRYADRKAQLEAIVEEENAKGVPTESLWGSFSEVPKLGIYPRAADGSTPLGVYAYPVTYILKQGFDNVPYGSGRPYVLIFQVVKKSVLHIKQDDKSEIENLQEIQEIIRGTNFTDLLDKKESQAQQIVQKFLNNLNKKLGKEPYNSEYTRILDLITNKVSRIFSHLRYNYNDWSGTAIQRLEKMNWKGKLEEIKSQIEEEAKDYIPDENGNNPALKEKLIDIIKNISYHREYRPYDSESPKIFKDVNPETMAGIYSDEYRKWYANYYGYDEENSPLEKEVPLQSMLRWYAFRDNSENTRLARAWINFSSPFTKAVLDKDFINRIFKYLEAKIEKFIADFKPKYENVYQNIRFPWDLELKKFAQENELDWHEALRDTLPHMSGKETTAGSFLYYFTRTLARQLIEKLSNKGEYGRKYYIVWTNILRKITGYGGVADAEGTGTIYSSEPVQGAFFDARQLRWIHTIYNRSHVGNLDPTGRPTASDWRRNDDETKGGAHIYSGPNKDPKTQRVGHEISWKSGESPIIRTLRGINSRLSSAMYDISYIFHTHNAAEPSAKMAQLLKLVLAFLKLEKYDVQDPKTTEELETKQQFDGVKAQILNLYNKFNHALQYYSDVSYGVPQHVQQEIKNKATQFKNFIEYHLNRWKRISVESPAAKSQLKPGDLRKVYPEPEPDKAPEEAEGPAQCCICGEDIPNGTKTLLKTATKYPHFSGNYWNYKHYCEKHWIASDGGKDDSAAEEAWEKEKAEKAAKEEELQKAAAEKVKQASDPAAMKAALKAKIKQIKKKELKAKKHPLTAKLDLPPPEPDDSDVVHP